MKTLNITNGDSAANLMRDGGIEGDLLVWRDPMTHGPFPPDLSLDALNAVRAAHLAGHGLTAGAIEQDFQSRNDHLRCAGEYDVVRLWFEHDLLDQLQILQILDWFSGVSLEGTDLQMICINTFPDIVPFRGLGQLNGDQLAGLLPQSQPVTDGMRALAKNGWAAFRSENPMDLPRFLATDLSPLPFLEKALHRHLEDARPSGEGLTRTEQQILTLVQSGITTPNDLFRKNMECEDALFIGDLGTYHVIAKLCRKGLLICDPAPFWYPAMTAQDREKFQTQRLYLTP